MKKWREIKDEPITWGGYAKFAGLCVGIMIVLYVITAVADIIYYYAYMITDKIRGIFYDIRSKFNKK